MVDPVTRWTVTNAIARIDMAVDGLAAARQMDDENLTLWSEHLRKVSTDLRAALDRTQTDGND